ncbi:MAG: RNA polymerase sigma factor [Prevotella sp.]|nr:RNA polymerase sigma factor [Prevotella sp.]
MTQEEYKEEARRLRPQMMNVARRYLADNDAEDTVQDALLRLWQMVDKLRMPLDGLASVLVRNLCVDKERRRHRTLALTEAGDNEDNGQDERIERMMGIIESLPSLQQTILRLRHMEGMEMKDIAEIIGSSEVALRKALSRARQAVRQQYMKQYDEQ